MARSKSAFLSTLFKITARRDGEDFELSRHLHRGRVSFGKDFRALLILEGGFHPSRATKYERMAKVHELVPEKAVWRAVGWSCVSLLERVGAKRARSRIKRDILKRANGQGVVANPYKVVWELIAKHSPSTAQPKPGKGDSRSPSGPSATQVILAELSRLCQDLPILRPHLSEQVRSMLDRYESKPASSEAA